MKKTININLFYANGDITYYIVRHEIKDNTDYEAIIK